MTETVTPETLVASLTAALDADEARANAMEHFTVTDDEFYSCPATRDGDIYDDGLWGESACNCGLAAAKAKALRTVAAHREIVDRYAETLRDYARTLERARGGPVGNADLDDFEAELPVLRSVVEIIAGIYEEPGQ